MSGLSAVYHSCGDSVSPFAPIPGDINSVARLIPRMLLDIQNRGQLAAGMSSYHPGRKALIKTYKELGTVAEAFRLNHKAKFEAIMRGQDGPAAIGHVRYATHGGIDRTYAQPLEREHGRKAKWFAVAFDGQITNYAELKQELLEQGDYHLKHDTDTEILMHLLSHELQAEGQDTDWPRVFSRLSDLLDGAYNVVLLSATGDLVVARDPLGFRPLCVAEHGPLFAAASESVPLANLGFKDIRSLEPGWLAVANQNGVRFERFAASPRRAHCFFEWVYFANVASALDDRSVYLSRARLGEELAQLEDVPLDAETIIVPVPDTGKAAADAMAFALGVRSVEGLMRNRYMGRTVLEGTVDRAARARLKYTPLPEVLAGKRVLLVEDSIVRSTTMRALVHDIRDRGGAREIHLRVTCPPIFAPCFYGIDMSRRTELFAATFLDIDERFVSETAQRRMARELGVDSLRYLPPAAITSSLSLSASGLCRACITGDYPTPAGQRLYQIDLGSSASVGEDFDVIVDVAIGMPHVDYGESEEQIEQFRESVTELMEAFGFELAPEHQPVFILGSWLGKMMFRPTANTGQKAVGKSLDEMHECLAGRSSASLDTEVLVARTAAIGTLLERIAGIDEVAVKIDNLILCKYFSDGRSRLVIGTISTSVARELERNPELLWDLQALIALLESPRPVNRASRETNPRRSRDVAQDTEVDGTVSSGRSVATGGARSLSVLFLAANPASMSQLSLDEEIRAIDLKIRGATHRDRLSLFSHWAVHLDDLSGLLMRKRPHIVHFSGHGERTGEIVLQSDTRTPRPVSPEALAELFRILKENIRVVFLNACYSQKQARGIINHIDCAVGISTAIADDAAIAFAAEFYQALAYGRSVQDAFDLGRVRLMGEGVQEAEELANLYSRDGTDPASVFFF